MTLPAPLPFLLYQLGFRPEPEGIPARITISADVPEICVKRPRAVEAAGGMDRGGKSSCQT